MLYCLCFSVACDCLCRVVWWFGLFSLLACFRCCDYLLAFILGADMFIVFNSFGLCYLDMFCLVFLGGC